MTVVTLATRNEHKLREFQRLLPGVELRPLDDEVELPPETGDSFAANALIKARKAAEATGGPAIADDSGIGAEALAWGPGIYSARYAGESASDEENLSKLIDEVPVGSKLAYTCVIAYVDPIAGTETTIEGRCEGAMSPVRSGSRGFGYDPVFLPSEISDGRTMADLTDAEKDAISHRGKAARKVLERGILE